MTKQEELDRCDREIALCEQGTCIGAAIGWFDWQVEKRIIGRKPLAIDLFCGLGGWTEGLLAEGWRVIGFDIHRHEYGEARYPGQMVIQDVLTLHGSQFRGTDLIVASPPCQAYSYRAMPFKKAKALPPPSNELFDACFRLQREASAAAGRFIPMIVENVKGAQPWVGRAAWHYGSFYLWGDVPALMPPAIGLRKVNHHLNGEVPKGTGKSSWFFGNTKHELRDGIKAADGTYGTRGWVGQHGGTNVMKDDGGYGVKQGGDWFGKGENMSMSRRFSSRSAARKAASAQIAKIPLPLSRHIARVFAPIEKRLIQEEK